MGVCEGADDLRQHALSGHLLQHIEGGEQMRMSTSGKDEDCDCGDCPTGDCSWQGCDYKVGGIGEGGAGGQVSVVPSLLSASTLFQVVVKEKLPQLLFDHI